MRWDHTLFLFRPPRGFWRPRPLRNHASQDPLLDGLNPLVIGAFGDREALQIGALVMKEGVVDRQDMAVAVDRRADVVALLARVIGRHQMLAPVLDPFDRAPKAQRS